MDVRLEVSMVEIGILREEIDVWAVKAPDWIGATARRANRRKAIMLMNVCRGFVNVEWKGLTMGNFHRYFAFAICCIVIFLCGSVFAKLLLLERCLDQNM